MSTAIIPLSKKLPHDSEWVLIFFNKKFLYVYWRDLLLAVCPINRVVDLGGQKYLPKDCIMWKNLKLAGHRSTCIWKGNAKYYDLIFESTIVPHIAWQYDEPKSSFEHLKNYISFDKKFVSTIVKRHWLKTR